MVTPLKFHSNVVVLAKEKNISISQLERNAGFSLGTIKSWKKSLPSGDKIIKVAEQLEVSLDFLLDRTMNPYSHRSNNYSNATLKILRVCEEIAVTDQAANILVSIIKSVMKEL